MLTFLGGAFSLPVQLMLRIPSYSPFIVKASWVSIECFKYCGLYPEGFPFHTSPLCLPTSSLDLRGVRELQASGKIWQRMGYAVGRKGKRCNLCCDLMYSLVVACVCCGPIVGNNIILVNCLFCYSVVVRPTVDDFQVLYCFFMLSLWTKALFSKLLKRWSVPR